MVSQSRHALGKAGGSVFVFYWMFDKQTDIMRASDSLQQRRTIFRKLNCPFCITIRRMAPMDVGGILIYLRKTHLIFRCQLWQLLALFKCGKNVACTAAVNCPRGLVSVCFHRRFYHPVRDAFFFVENLLCIHGCKKKMNKKKITLRLYSTDVCFFMVLWPVAMW